MVKNVIFVGKFDPYTPIPSGVRGYVLGLSKAFNSLGIKTKLIGYSPSIDTNEKFINVIKEKDISELKFTLFLYFHSIFLRFSNKIPRDAIIHAQRADHAFPFIFFNNKLIFTIHGKTEQAKEKHGLFIYILYSLIESVVVRKCDFTIAVSEDLKDYFVDKYPFLRQKIAVIDNGVDLEIFKKLNKGEVRTKFNLDNEKVVLFIGRLHPEKNVELLIESFSALKDKLNKFKIKLLIVGDGVLKNDLLKLAENIGVYNETFFLGRVDDSEIPQIINCADVLALPSVVEGFPLVVLEALACGVPVVSTNVGDVSKVVINNKTGFIVDNFSLSDFTEKLEYVICNNRLFTENCVTLAQNYSWEDVTLKTLEVYYNLHPDITSEEPPSIINTKYDTSSHFQKN